MVLQRGMHIPVWGRCDGVDRIAVSLIGAEAEVSTEAVIEDGNFFAKLPPFNAGANLKLVLYGYCGISETEHVEFSDVAVGEVFIAGGQSNMEFPLKNDCEADVVSKLPEDRLFRYYDVKKISYDTQEQDMSYDDYGFWRHFTTEDCAWFSSVSVFFGLKLRSELDVPVGIIGCNWGATSASCWMERKYLEEYGELGWYLDTYEESQKSLDLEWYREKFFERQRLGQSPRMHEIDEAIAKGTMTREEMKQLMENIAPEVLELLSLPTGPMDHTRPCYLFDSMVKRIAGYASRGVIWYQGEADGVRSHNYAVLFSQMVKCWRDHWKSDLPFLCVQLAPFGEWLSDTGKEFPMIRSQQQHAEDMIDGVWLVSIMDHGMEHDIHPKSKRAAGERLALLALGKLYGKDILCEAPRFVYADWEAEKITLYMKNAGDGLTCATGIPEGMVLLENGKQVEFTAKTEGSCIVLFCKKLADTSHVQVSYAYLPYVEANIYNSAGLCAKPFVAVRNWVS